MVEKHEDLAGTPPGEEYAHRLIVDVKDDATLRELCKGLESLLLDVRVYYSADEAHEQQEEAFEEEADAPSLHEVFEAAKLGITVGEWRTRFWQFAEKILGRELTDDDFEAGGLFGDDTDVPMTLALLERERERCGDDRAGRAARRRLDGLARGVREQGGDR
jgi:hypothetical protein